HRRRSVRRGAGHRRGRPVRPRRARLAARPRAVRYGRADQAPGRGAGAGPALVNRMPVAPAILADAVAVLTFAIIGMSTHGTLLLELGRVAWPFAVGGAVGWAWTRAWRDPARIWPVGIAVWFSTVALGLM